MYLALAALLQLATPQAKTGSDVLALVPVLINAALSDAQNQGVHRSVDTPVIVNVTSFAFHGSMATERELESKDVELVIGRRYTNATAESAIHCTFATGGESPESCAVIDDGLYVELDCLSSTASGFQALLAYHWTDLRPSGRSAIGRRQLRVWLWEQNGRWVVRKTSVVMST